MVRNQFLLTSLYNEAIVDNFAGGGGASTGIELALGRPVDVAINHDPIALALHEANHPQTEHFREDVFKVDPVKATRGRPVGLAWFSPDCKHFSKAKGGKPRSKKIRGLAWVVIKWAKAFRDAKLPMPRVIVMENVEEFLDWGPLLQNRSHKRGCVCGQPCGLPDPTKKGRTFRIFINKLKRLGYVVDWRELRAYHYGAPTIRKRFVLIARCDGRPIVWPKPTHGSPKEVAEAKASGRALAPWRTAAECIDWSIPCHSIFLTPEEVKARGLNIKRPLADATMRRIARGMFKFVLNAKEPFIVPLTHHGSDRVEAATEPFRTITGAHRGEKAVVQPLLDHITPEQSKAAADFYNSPAGKKILEELNPPEKFDAPYLIEHANGSHSRSFNAEEPLRTQCAEVKGGHFALVNAFLAKHYGGHETPGSPLTDPAGTITARDHNALVASTLVQTGYGERDGQAPRVPGLEKPLGTVVAGGQKHALVAAHMAKFRFDSPGSDAQQPLPTITAGSYQKRPAGAGHALGLVSSHLTKLYGTTTGQEQSEPLHTVTGGGQHLGEVRAFLMKYYGEGGQDQDITDPLHTITTKDRLGLVTVQGQLYAIADIGMRMLVPRELYRGQGFPETYIIDIEVTHERRGQKIRKALTQEEQVRMCGNSVPPQLAEAIVRANCPDLIVWKPGERRRFDAQQQRKDLVNV